MKDAEGMDEQRNLDTYNEKDYTNKEHRVLQTNNTADLPTPTAELKAHRNLT